MIASGLLRRLFSSITLYLPVVVMGVLALGTWWLARNTPTAPVAEPERAKRQDPDYFLTNFSVKNFDAQGILISEVFGQKARHLPETDVLEIDTAQMRASRAGRITTGRGNRAYSNGDGSEVQLVGDAFVIREASRDSSGRMQPRIEFRGEFLHAFLRTDEIKSHKPVSVIRGSDEFSGDKMLYNKAEGIVQLDGRVRVRMESKRP